MTRNQVTLECKPLKEYLPLYEGLSGKLSEPRIVSIPAPRHSYKTTHLAESALAHYVVFRNCDIIIGVDKVTEAGEGVLAEIKSYIIGKGLNKNNSWELDKKDELYHRAQTNRIRVYAAQTQKRADINITKGKKALRPASMIIFDEVQKLHSREVLLNAISTFTRQAREVVDTDAQVKTGYSLLVLAGNKERNRHHWYNKWIEEIRQDNSFMLIEPTYLIAPKYVGQLTQKIIDNLMKNDVDEYNYMYLGKSTGIDKNAAFPQFNRSIHLKKKSSLLHVSKADDVVIGVDHASANDALTAVPLALLNDGKTIALERFYDSPKVNGIKAPSEQAYLFRDYLVWLNRRYNFVGNQTQVCISIDCAAAGFIAQLRLLKDTDRANAALWSLISIYEFTNKDKERNLGIIRDVLRNQLITILEDEEDWVWHIRPAGMKLKEDQLVYELEAQIYIYDEQGKGRLDPTIPNDLTDALEYAVIPLFINCFHVYFPSQKYVYDDKTGYVKEVA